MQIGNQRSYELNTQGSYNKHNQILANVTTPKQSDSFGQEPVRENPEPKKKNPYSLKNMTNVLGVVLGLSAIIIPAVASYRRPQAVKLLESANKIEKKINTFKSSSKETIIKSQPGYKKGNFFYRTGLKIDKMIGTSEELFNNIVYGVGTVIIMPLVILLSPFGKEKSTKEDRMFTILRQPLSFVTMFSMQLTVDKFFKGLVPEMIKRNLLEDPELLEEGKFKDNIDINKVKFNTEVIESDIKLTLSELLGWNKDKIRKLYKLKQPEIIKDHLEAELKNNHLEEFKLLADKLDRQIAAKNRGKLLGQGLVIATNVLFSAPVGCTLLNVIYGKAMKKYGPKPSDKQQENAVKGGNK